MKILKMCSSAIALAAAAVFFIMPLQAAQGNYYSPGESKAPAAEPGEDAPNSFTVTSIQKCYAQLGREDALDIQRNYIKPYQECQRRLTLKLKEKQKAGSKEEKNQPQQKPHNFYRVQQDSGKPDDDAGRDKSGKHPVSEENVKLK